MEKSIKEEYLSTLHTLYEEYLVPDVLLRNKDILLLQLDTDLLSEEEVL